MAQPFLCVLLSGEEGAELTPTSSHLVCDLQMKHCQRCFVVEAERGFTLMSVHPSSNFCFNMLGLLFYSDFPLGTAINAFNT